MANDNPDVAAIFSPATDTVAKAIAKIRPAVSPSASSRKIVSINCDANAFVKSGVVIHPCKNIASENMSIILTFSGTIREPKNGAAIKNAPILKDSKSKSNSAINIKFSALAGT